MSNISSELSNSKEWAQTLPKLADDAQKMTSNVESLGKLTETHVRHAMLFERKCK